ncbi:MAG: AraC family transcriptional regulator [Nitrospira sp.]
MRALTTELRLQAPLWADRLAQVASERELLELVSDLFNLTHALQPTRHEPPAPEASLPARLRMFISTNLHKGLTLKVLSQFLGYSEKYCSDVFQHAMGESFSEHLKRRRIETAHVLLTTTEYGVAEIAAAIGFGDQFAFSHFFKRATGQSPLQFRVHHRQHLRKPRPPAKKGSP